MTHAGAAIASRAVAVGHLVFVFAKELRHEARAIPYCYVMTVHKLLCGFDSCCVVQTLGECVGLRNTAVIAKNISAIIRHAGGYFGNTKAIASPTMAIPAAMATMQNKVSLFMAG